MSPMAALTIKDYACSSPFDPSSPADISLRPVHEVPPQPISSVMPEDCNGGRLTEVVERAQKVDVAEGGSPDNPAHLRQGAPAKMPVAEIEAKPADSRPALQALPLALQPMAEDSVSVSVGPTVVAPVHRNDDGNPVEVVPGEAPAIHIREEGVEQRTAIHLVAAEGEGDLRKENSNSRTSSSRSSRSARQALPIISPEPRKSLNLDFFYQRPLPRPPTTRGLAQNHTGGEPGLATRKETTESDDIMLSPLQPFASQRTQHFMFPPGFVPNSGFRTPSPSVTPFIPPLSTPISGAPPITRFPPHLFSDLPPLVSPRQEGLKRVRYAPLVEEHNESPIPISSRPTSAYSTLVCGNHRWRQYIHPNGSLYWTYPVQGVVSDNLPHFDTIESLAQQQSLHYFPQWEVYLVENSLHFIDHKSRSMSSNRQSLPEFRRQIARRLSNIETALELEERYWTFVQSHPNHTAISDNTKDEAEEALLWCYADRRLFESSTAPFEKESAQEMLAILQQLSAVPRTTLKVWFIAAIMRSVVQARSASHYGTLNARNYRQLEKSDELPNLETSWSAWHIIMWHVLSLLAFGAPVGYLKRIINVNRPSGISTQRWQAFLKNLSAEWADSNLLSVVLVSGTVGMLAMPGLNGVAQIAAFNSIFCALTAVLTGMLLISTHRGRMESTGRAAFLYFDYAKRMTGSPHILAVLLSLPLTLMIWGMVWFVISVVSSAYQPGLPNIPHVFQTVLRFTSIAVVCTLAVVVSIVAWFFLAQWRPGPVENKQAIVSPVPQVPDPLTFNPQWDFYSTPAVVATYHQRPPEPPTMQRSYGPQSAHMQPQSSNHKLSYSEASLHASPSRCWQKLRDYRRRRHPNTDNIPFTGLPVWPMIQKDFHDSAAIGGYPATPVAMGVPPGQPIPLTSRPVPTDPTAVQPDPVVKVLSEHRLAQLATVEQQREIMRYMRGLNEWLERDVHDRQSELRSVSARVEQLRNDIRQIRAQDQLIVPPLEQQSTSDVHDVPPVVLANSFGE